MKRVLSVIVASVLSMSMATNVFAVQIVSNMKQLNAPSDAFVLERLGLVDTIFDKAAVTTAREEGTDLGKPGSFIGKIYFADASVDRSRLYLEGWEDVIEVGTDGGGCVEVYRTAADANRRSEYLGCFDGTILDSGSHQVYGTCVIRTSSKLTLEQQTALTGKVVNALAVQVIP